MRKILIFGFLIFVNMSIHAQNIAVGIKFFGLSIHPLGALNTQHMPLKFDKKGIFVLNLGVEICFEYFIYKDIVSVKFIQALYADCVQKFAGFTHLGLRGRIFETGKHSLYGGIGPTFIYRKNWYALEGYDDSFSFFRGEPEDTWQRRFIWYGGEFEYNYAINENLSLSTSFVPGFPDLMNLAVGIRYKN
jgi:hypothetical protein